MIFYGFLTSYVKAVALGNFLEQLQGVLSLYCLSSLLYVLSALMVPLFTHLDLIHESLCLFLQL